MEFGMATRSGRSQAASVKIKPKVAYQVLEVSRDGRINEAVFGIHLLSEIIFDYTLRSKEEGSDDYYPTIRREDLCNIRLVSKCWQDSLSKFLEKKKEPLYVVTMTASNSLNEAPEVQINGKVLENFVNFLKTRNSRDAYAGFTLKIKKDAFRLENYDPLLTFLRECGKHLVEIDLDVPMNGGSFPGQFPNSLEFPVLKKINLGLCDEFELENLTPAEKLLNPSANVIQLIQSLLQYSSNTLKHLHVYSWWIPSDFQYINFPTSLVTLEIPTSQNPRMLECLIRNRLPAIKELTLNYNSNYQYPNKELIFQVFKNFRENLRVLRIRKCGDEFDLDRKLTLRFPVMESLKTLSIDGAECELDSEMCSLSTLFPSLTHMKLRGVDDDIVNQLSSTISSVTTLEFYLDFVLLREWPLPLEAIKGIHRAFPNLTDLHISHWGTPFEDLQYVFREMRQLKRLTIGLMEKENITTSDHYDALLLGAPMEFIKDLKKCSQKFWKTVEMKVNTENSITMLKELTYLKLCDERFQDATRRGPLISDIAFVFALNGMTNLQHVKLGRPYSVSQEIVEEWESQGRKIEEVIEKYN